MTRAQVQKVETGAISTRTPHAGSDVARVDEALDGCISTRTPHAGSDNRVERDILVMQISTRTPHAGSDIKWPITFQKYTNFNPHSPCGE